MNRLYRGLAATLILLVLSGCGNDAGYSTPIVVPSAELRVVNLIPDSPQLTSYINESIIGSVNFRSSTAFDQILPQVQVRFTVRYVSGSQIVEMFKDEPLYLDLDEAATIVLAGTMANPQILSFINPPRADVPTDELELQFGHAASNFDAPVSVTVLKDAATVQTLSLDFADISSRSQLTPGDFRILVHDQATNDLLWDSGDFSLSGGVRGFVVLSDYFGPGTSPVRMLSVGTNFTTTFANEVLPASMRFVNLIPDEGPVDVYIDDVLTFSNVSFRELADYTIAGDTSTDIRITPFGDSATTLAEGTELAVNNGFYHTLAATGVGGTNELQVYTDDLRRVATRVLLTAVNGAPSNGNFDIYILSETETVDNFGPNISTLVQIPLENSSRSIPVREGSFDLYVVEAGTKNVLFGPDRADLVNNGLYTLFLTDPAGGGDGVEVLYADDFD
jgi:hypothetical protein